MFDVQFSIYSGLLFTAFKQNRHLAHTVLKFNRFPYVLLQIVLYLIMHGDGMVDPGVTARDIGADVDQIFRLAIGGHDLLELIRVLPVILIDNIVHHTADASQDIYRRIMVLHGQIPGQIYMTV